MKLYSLPHACPFPWPTNPTYAIQPDPISTSLPALYLTTLYSTGNLDTFSHHLISLRSAVSDSETTVLQTSLRNLLLPASDFDKRWRYTIPLVVVPPPVTADVVRLVENGKEGKGSKGALSEEETGLVLGAYEGWKRKKVESKGKGGAGGGDVEMGGTEEKVGERGERWTTQEDGASDWLRELELLETRIQVLLLLTLISIPISDCAIPPKRKKNPERHASTLDPELLLDFLTDRLQVWSAIKSLGATGTLDAPTTGADGTKDVAKDDDVTWWKEIVERSFSLYVPPVLLVHHSTKLFPTSTTLFQPPTHSPSHPSTTAGPSPFKPRTDRTLLSLDKSARKKWSGNQKLLESPTMKKLVAASTRRAGEREGEREVFKVPAPRKASVSNSNNNNNKVVASSSTSSMSWMDEEELAEEAAERLVDARKLAEREEAKGMSAGGRTRPRKQERPRPLPRGDALTGSKGLFNRREVSLGKKRVGVKTVVPVPTEKGKERAGESNVGLSRGTKRKSVSPRKLSTSDARTLVPDTPQKPLPVNRPTFTRTASLPSFASLGAAFRPGAPPPADLPFGIPPPPVLDQRDERNMGTPEQKKRAWIIPDT